MPFAYYKRLSTAQRRTYLKSDAVTSMALPRADELREAVQALERALRSEDRLRVEAIAHRLVNGLCRRLGASAVNVVVLARRPSGGYGELHGLYDPNERPPRVTVWMRTAQRRQVVAFRSFLRTLLHELCHHVDYEILRLDESFHTEGFYQRESSLFRQLVPEVGRSAGRVPVSSGGAPRGG